MDLGEREGEDMEWRARGGEVGRGAHEGCHKVTLGVTRGTVSQSPDRKSPSQCEAQACGALILTASWGPRPRTGPVGRFALLQGSLSCPPSA